MNREGQDTLLLFVGVMVLQVGITDLHLRYVKPAMQPLLVGAGLVLTVLAVVSIVRWHRSSREPTIVTASPTEHVPGGALAASDDPSHTDEHGHDHAHMPRTAWLLALPLLVLTLITPPSLGAYAAARGTATVDEPRGEVAPLPAPVDGAVDLTLTSFATRGVYAPETLEGTPVRLTGFALPDEDGGWSVARIALSCCAADGRPVRVKVNGAAAPTADSWVTVVGRFTGTEGEGRRRVPVLEVSQLTPVEAPVQQYE